MKNTFESHFRAFPATAIGKPIAVCRTGPRQAGPAALARELALQAADEGRKRCVMAEYNRFETPMVPGSYWPDGSPVSNWSQAVAALAGYGRVPGELEARSMSRQHHDRRASEEPALLAFVDA